MQSKELYRTSPMAQNVKNLPAMQETQVWSLGQEDTLEKGMATLSSPAFLPEESQRQRSLVGCSPQSHKESDITEWLTLSRNFIELDWTVLFEPF